MTSGGRIRRSDDLDALRIRAQAAEEEVTVLRRRLQESPRRVQTLEEKLLETKGQLAQAISQNEKLTFTLQTAKEHMANLREEVEKLTQPPAAYGTFLGTNDDGTVDVFSGGRKMRVSLHPDIDPDELQRGNEVVLNESLNVILAREGEGSGEVVVLKEVLEDGRRALVFGRADEERVAELSDALIGVKLRAGDTILMESRTGLLIEKLARPEVEELVLEEVPDVTYADVGGLDEQIEAITDAVELPVPLPGALRRAQAAGPQGDPALRPARVRQDADRQGGGQLAGQEGGRGHRQHQRPELLPQHQGPRAPQQVRGGDRAPDPPGLPAGPGEVGGGRAGHRLLRRDGLAVPDPGHRHQLGHGVDHRAPAAGGDRRRGDPARTSSSSEPPTARTSSIRPSSGPGAST